MTAAAPSAKPLLRSATIEMISTGICASSTAHRRFQEWTEQRVFEKLWASGLEEYDEAKGIKWRWQSMDGAMTKAPLGGEKNRAESNRPSKARRQTKPVV